MSVCSERVPPVHVRNSEDTCPRGRRYSAAPYRSGTDAVAVTEMRALRTSASLEGLAALRGYLVENLRHHHETKGRELWSMILNAAPEAVAMLAAFSEEHDRLDAALGSLETAPVVSDADQEHLHQAADQVRGSFIAI